MVRVHVEGDQLVARLPWRLALAAGRRTVRVPVAPVTDVRVEPSWWRALRGTPGRHYRFRPARCCAGELMHAEGRDFIALIADEPALVVELEHWRSPYARMALTVSDPYGSADLLRQHARKTSEEGGRALSHKGGAVTRA
jgi:hypothetical protein